MRGQVAERLVARLREFRAAPDVEAKVKTVSRTLHGERVIQHGVWMVPSAKPIATMSLSEAAHMVDRS